MAGAAALADFMCRGVGHAAQYTLRSVGPKGTACIPTSQGPAGRTFSPPDPGPFHPPDAADQTHSLAPGADPSGVEST